MKNKDTVYVNGNVLTMDASNRIASAIAVRDGKIAAVGGNAEVSACIGGNTRVVDLDGRTLLPGFYDPHSHFPKNGMITLYEVDLNSPPIGTMRTMDDIIGALRKKAQTTPKGQWVLGRGYDDTLIAEGRHPTRDDLDAVSTEHPVWAVHISGHLGAANSVALKLAGIGAETPQPQGGVIRKDSAGEPNGVLEEPPAMNAVSELVPPRSDGQEMDGINAAAREYASRGVTTGQNASADKRTIETLIAAAEGGYLPIRALALPKWDIALEMSRGEYAVNLPANGMVKLSGAKLFADGSIQGYTGYLAEPYHVAFQGDAAYRGYPIFERERLAAIVGELHRAGWQVVIHGNGDAAIDDIIHAYGKAQSESPREDARHVIIHAQMAREDQLDSMAELAITPSFFSLHTYYWGDRHRDIFMGPERAMRISPARSAIERGIRFSIHCDTPVVPMTPLLLAWAAVNRISTGGSIIGAEQRLTPMEALRAITIDGAWQNFEEDITGSLEVGKRADLAILSEDPLAYPLYIRDIQVLETIVGGRTVFRR